jgi:hypothetical protein
LQTLPCCTCRSAGAFAALQHPFSPDSAAFDVSNKQPQGRSSIWLRGIEGLIIPIADGNSGTGFDRNFRLEDDKLRRYCVSGTACRALMPLIQIHTIDQSHIM